MIDKVVKSPVLPEPYREKAQDLLPLVATDPVRVRERLHRLAAEFSLTAVYTNPTTDLFRCMPAETVHRHLTAPQWQRIDKRTYLRSAATAPQPESFIAATIPAGKTLFTPERSWLIDAPIVLTLNTADLARTLELLPDRRPPFIIFRLTPARMGMTGVRIRPPNALDAAAGGHPQWSPNGLSVGTEYVDRRVPIEAVEEIVWKP